MKQITYFKEKGTGDFYKKESKIFVEKINFENDFILYESSINLFKDKLEPQENNLIEISEDEYFKIFIEVQKHIIAEKK